MEARPDHLIRRPTEGPKITLPDGSGRGWVGKGVRVHPLIDVMLSAVDVLPGDKQRIASTRVPVEGGAGPRGRPAVRRLIGREPVVVVRLEVRSWGLLAVLVIMEKCLQAPVLFY